MLRIIQRVSDASKYVGYIEIFQIVVGLSVTQPAKLFQKVRGRHPVLRKTTRKCLDPQY